MAIGYLSLIRRFTEATGNRDLFSAAPTANKIQSVPIEEGEQQAHFVYDTALSKHILRHSDIYLQDHFLDKLLAECPQERVSWIKLFVDKSPEFLNGTSHTVTRKSFKANIDRFTLIAKAKGFDDIATLILNALSEKNRSALMIAKGIIRLRFTQILQEILGANVIVNEELLFGAEIFTPSIRIRSNIYRLNDSTDHFIRSHVPEKLQNDEFFILPLLSLFYMAATPILASLVAFLNSKTTINETVDANAYVNFKMIPTNYVAREAAQDTELDGVHICKGDKLYVMLFESTGCPFSNNAMPFGYGKHLCPGSQISKLIINQCIQASRTIPLRHWSNLTPSSLQKGRGSAFLSFEDTLNCSPDLG
jgi:hypothetical protein